MNFAASRGHCWDIRLILSIHHIMYVCVCACVCFIFVSVFAEKFELIPQRSFNHVKLIFSSAAYALWVYADM